MSFAVKEIFYTLQGEGANAGRAAVFCRFAGCNLWTGLEADRAEAICDFCDTDFVGTDGEGGGRFATAEALAEAIAARWPAPSPPAPLPRRGEGSITASSPPAPLPRRGEGSTAAPSPLAPLPGGEGRKLVVCTGGEPLLQMNDEFVRALHERGFEVAIETNGTKLPPAGIDWICVSPKANADLVLQAGDELKLIFPQLGAEPERFANLDFTHFFLQPMDGPERERNTQLAVRYCLEHPHWRLSLQTQKVLGIK